MIGEGVWRAASAVIASVAAAQALSLPVSGPAIAGLFDGNSPKLGTTEAPLARETPDRPLEDQPSSKVIGKLPQDTEGAGAPEGLLSQKSFAQEAKDRLGLGPEEGSGDLGADLVRKAAGSFPKLGENVTKPGDLKGGYPSTTGVSNTADSLAGGAGAKAADLKEGGNAVAGKLSNAFDSLTGDAGDKVKDAASEGGNAAASGVSNAVDNLTSGGGADVADLPKEGGNSIKAGLSNVFNSLIGGGSSGEKNPLKEGGDAAASNVTNAADNVAGEAGAKAADLKDGGRAVSAKVSNVFNSLTGDAGAKVKDAASEGGDAAASGVSNAVDNLTSGGGANVKDLAKDGGSSIKSGISNVFNSLTGSGDKNPLKEGGEAATANISNALDNAVGAAGGNTKDISKDAGNAAMSGISSAIDSLKSAGSASKTDLTGKGGSGGLADVTGDSNTNFGGYEGGNKGVADSRNSELQSQVPTDTSNRDNRNLGPNEIGQDFIRSLPYASETDTAAPDRAPTKGSSITKGERAASVEQATQNVTGAAQGLADKAVGNQPKESTYSTKGGPWNWLFPKTGLNSILPVLSDLAELADGRNSEIQSPVPTNTANRDNLNLGPNEVGKDLIQSLPNASPTDAASPERSTPLSNFTVSPDVVRDPTGNKSRQGVEGGNPISNVVDKAKNALPDLSELPSPVPINTANRDNRNLGPNEVGKDLLKSLPNASPTDSVAPGRASGGSSGDFVGDKILDATEKFAPEALKRGDDGATKAASDAIKGFLNLGGGN
eukprot:jgi/Botrbrau1/2684/Bobra.0203s0027.2